VTADPVLVLAWLVAAHLAADFVFQWGRLVRAKTMPGGRGARGLLIHGAIVAALLLPVVAAFGVPGWRVLVTVVVTHVAIDWTKIVLTRRAEAAAAADAARRHEPSGSPVDGLGPAWTPLPAVLFALDQLAHLAVLGGAWLAFLSTAPLEPGFVTWAGSWLADRDQAVVHEVAVRTVVLASLLVVNVRAGALFVAVLVGARAPTEGRVPPAASAATAPLDATPAARRMGWTVRLGPLTGRAVPDAETGPVPETARPSAAAPPARVGEAIGILERLLVVTFVLVRAEAAIGLVIAAKTLARFRQLDDRDFAEYYLLGTLASVAIAAISAFAAVAVLDTLG